MKLVVVLALEALAGMRCMGGDEGECSRILHEIAAREEKDTIVINYQFDTYFSGSRLPRDEIQLKADAIRDGYPKGVPGKADDPRMESALEQMAEDYTAGREHGADRSTRWGTLILAPDFMALKWTHSVDDGYVEEWAVRKGDVCYDYAAGNKQGWIGNKSGGEGEELLEEAAGSVGLLGTMPGSRGNMVIDSMNAWDKWVRDTDDKSACLWREGANIHLAEGTEGITVEDMGSGKYRLRSFERDLPDVPRFEKTSFGAYGKYGDDVAPGRVRAVVCAARRTVVTYYTVKTVSHCAKAPAVPFVNAELPAMEVTDGRFDPPISYRVVSKLPDDRQVAEWVNDPKALEKYNETVGK